MADDTLGEAAQALARIPCGLFVLTSAFEDARSGILATWVQQCSTNPPMVMVAMPRGHVIEPLMRDSRSFALCQLSEDDRFLHRKFACRPGPGEDPFMSIDTTVAPSGSPIISRAMGYVDCTLVRRIDLDSAYAIYVGRVNVGEILHDVEPAVRLGLNGHDNSNGQTK